MAAQFAQFWTDSGLAKNMSSKPSPFTSTIKNGELDQLEIYHLGGDIAEAENLVEKHDKNCSNEVYNSGRSSYVTFGRTSTTGTRVILRHWQNLSNSSRVLKSARDKCTNVTYMYVINQYNSFYL